MRGETVGTLGISSQIFRNRGALLGAVLIVVIALAAAIAPLSCQPIRFCIVGPPELWPGEDPVFLLNGFSRARHSGHGGSRRQSDIDDCAVREFGGYADWRGDGAIAGYSGGWIDESVMRLAELFQTIPNLIRLDDRHDPRRPTLNNIVIAIGVVSWTSIARMTRVEFMSLRDRNSCRRVVRWG